MNFLYSESENGLIITGCDCDMEEIKIPSQIDRKNVYSIGHNSFFGKNVKKLFIAEGIKAIESFAFSKC
ncbi:MAG: leucine-rich repeat domain-containing protein, partial [Clostridia bacterium]|nr:leucine-rich repeat domain-containing protein [Clostridia bacterium]